MQTNNTSLRINEIFYSLQGESSLVGYPTVFVRTTGCPLRCGYCDTKYAYHEGEIFSLDEIEKKILSFKASYVCLTGGEPLAQKNIYPLMSRLCDLKLFVSLETSGAIFCNQVDPRVRKIIDVKTPGSKEEKTFQVKNLEFADKNTEFKFVLCSVDDFHWAEEFCQKHQLFEKTNVLYSPSYKEMAEKKLAELILENKSQARMQIQLHKYLFGDIPGV